MSDPMYFSSILLGVKVRKTADIEPPTPTIQTLVADPFRQLTAARASLCGLKRRRNCGLPSWRRTEICEIRAAAAARAYIARPTTDDNDVTNETQSVTTHTRHTRRRFSHVARDNTETTHVARPAGAELTQPTRRRVVYDDQQYGPITLAKDAKDERWRLAAQQTITCSIAAAGIYDAERNRTVKHVPRAPRKSGVTYQRYQQNTSYVADSCSSILALLCALYSLMLNANHCFRATVSH